MINKKENTYVGKENFIMAYVYGNDNDNNNNGSASSDNSQTTGSYSGQSTNGTGSYSGQSTNGTGSYSGQSTNGTGAYSGQPASGTGSYSGQVANGTGSYSGQPTNGTGSYSGQPTNGTGSYSGQPTNGTGSYNGQGNYGYGGYGSGQNYSQGSYMNNGVPYSAGGPDKKNKKNKKKHTMHRMSKTALRTVALILAGVLAGSLVTYGFNRGRNAGSKTASESTQEEATLHKSDDTAKSETESKSSDKSASSKEADSTVQTTGADSSMSVSEIATKCMPCVVAITNKGTTEVRSMWGNFTQDSESSGSGVIIGETDSELLILTNYHVIEGSQQLSVVFSWEDETDKSDADNADIITAQVKDYDENNDIAVISIPMSELSDTTKSKISVATVGDSTSLELGQQVVAIGNALGYGQSITTGIISALDREISIQNDSGTTVTNKYIQTDAAINPGNSGGAMFNMKGELVGINSAKISSDQVEGMGYAIPISDIMSKVEKMMNQETKAVVQESKRGYLGVSIIDVTSDISSSYGMPQGVYISAVSSGTGAEAAGLTKGDIITGVNGKTVTTTTELKNYLSYYAVGDTVTITIERQGDNGYVSKSVDVKLSEAPKETSSGSSDSGNSGNSGSGNSGNSGSQGGSGNSGSSGDNGENEIQQFFFGGQGNGGF